MTKTETRPYVSGWCGEAKPEWSHKECRGDFPTDRDYPNNPTSCDCDCHQPADRTSLAREAILEARSTAGDVGDALLDLTPDTWEEAVEMLHHLRLARKTLAAAESTLETKAAAMMRDLDGVQEIPGIGSVQRRGGKSRKAWQHDELAKKVLDCHMTGGDGELPTPWEVRDWLLSAAAVSYWRVGVLKELDIDPDEYAEVTWGRATVEITTNETVLNQAAS